MREQSNYALPEDDRSELTARWKAWEKLALVVRSCKDDYQSSVTYRRVVDEDFIA